MGKKMTYDDVLADAVYSILEMLRIKHEAVIIKKFKTSDVLLMDYEQLGEMVKLIKKVQTDYETLVKEKFKELKNQYLSEDNYDPSGETKKTTKKIKDYNGELKLF